MVHRRGLKQLIASSLPMQKIPGDKMWDRASDPTLLPTGNRRKIQEKRRLKGYSLVPRMVSQNRNEMGSLKSLVAIPDQECRDDPNFPTTISQCPTTTNSSIVVDDGWMDCAKEKGFCTTKDCPIGSHVRFGCGKTWSPLPNEPTILVSSPDLPVLCSREIFGDPFPSMGKLCQCRKPSHDALESHHGFKIIVLTFYGGIAGHAYEDATRRPLEKFAKTRGYQFEPIDENVVGGLSKTQKNKNKKQNRSNGGDDGARYKWVKLLGLRQTMDQHINSKDDSNDSTWIWWTDADVLFDPYTSHSLEEVIHRFLRYDTVGEETHIILLRRRVVTSSTILVRTSTAGQAFLRAWEDWRHRPEGRDHEYRWVSAIYIYRRIVIH